MNHSTGQQGTSVSGSHQAAPARSTVFSHPNWGRIWDQAHWQEACWQASWSWCLLAGHTSSLPHGPLHEVTHSTAVIFPRARAARRSKRGKSNMEVTVLYNLIWGDKPIMFFPILFIEAIKTSPDSKGEDYIRAWTLTGRDHWGHFRGCLSHNTIPSPILNNTEMGHASPTLNNT